MSTNTNGESPDERRRRGLQKMSEVYGWEFDDGAGDYFAITADHLFADIWSRPELSLRERRLLLIGALTAQGQFDVAEIQLGAALRNDEFTADQLREMALFLCHYVGWPLGTKLDGVAGKVAAQQQKSQQQTSQQK